MKYDTTTFFLYEKDKEKFLDLYSNFEDIEIKEFVKVSDDKYKVTLADKKRVD